MCIRDRNNALKRTKDKRFECAAVLAQSLRMWLCEQEQIILKYLKEVGEVGASAREVCRKSWTKDAYKKEERWAYRFLSSLKDKKLVETTPAGNYRIPPPEEEEEKKPHP